MNIKRKIMPLNSIRKLVMILSLITCIPEEVSCNETHRPGSIIDINLQYQAHHDVSDTSQGCPNLVAKITTSDQAIQKFLSLSRTKDTFNNILMCIEKSCLNTTAYVAMCPLKVEIQVHSITVSDFSYSENDLIRVEIKENVTSEVHLQDNIIRISSFQKDQEHIYQDETGAGLKQLESSNIFARNLESYQEETVTEGFKDHNRQLQYISSGPNAWGWEYRCINCGYPCVCDWDWVWRYAAPYLEPGPPPGKVNVLLGFSGSVGLSGLYNLGNYPYTWTLSDPVNKVSNPFGWNVRFTALPADDWALLGPRSFTSTLSGTHGVRTQTWTSFNVINKAPRFFPVAPANQEVFMNDTLLYTLPAYSDESGHIFSFDFNPKFPSWISIDPLNQVFNFTPTTFADVGVKTITITLDDTNMASNTAFTVTVINRPPIYDTPGVTYMAVSVYLNYKEDVMIPSFHDPDGSDAQAKIYEPTAVPVLWSVQPDYSKITFEPIGFNELGVHNAIVRLYDAGGAITDTSIQVTVLNKSPIFSWRPLPVQTIPMNISTDSTWTYWIYDYEGHVIDLTPWKLNSLSNLVAPPYFVTQAVPKSHTITVKAVKFSDIGLHKIQLKINDGGGGGFNYEELLINITNWAPYFVDDLKPLNHSLKMNNTFNYHLPKYTDRENNPVYISFKCLPSVSSWAKLTPDDSILFVPDKWSHVGHYECVLKLSDTRNASYYSFNIDVLNFPPKFTNGMKPQNIQVRLNQELEVELPVMIDTENNPIQVVQKLPQFVKYEGGKYKLNPKSPGYHLGFFIIRGEITDTQLSTPFKFFVQVTNDPPDFLLPAQNQVAYLGMKTEYQLPEIYDLEGLKYTVKVALANGDKLPQFIRLVKDLLKFDIPDDETLLGAEYVIKFTLDDGFSRPNVRSILLKLKSQDSLPGEGNGTFASLRVVSMTRDQLLTLRIVGVKGSEQLLDKITKQSFKIRVKETGEEIPYNVTVRSTSGSSITLRLGFQNLKLISSTAQLETLEIKAREKLSVLLSKRKTVIQLPCCIPVTVKIPPQIGSGLASVTMKVKKGAMVASQVGLTVGLIVNIGLSMFIQYLWGLLNDMSFLTVCSMISISVPGIGKILQSALMNFIYLDILQAELWLFPLLFPPKPQGEDDLEDMDQPLNLFFDENGFESKALIKNLGSTFVYLVLYMLLLAILPLIRVIGRRFAIMSRFSNWLSKQLLWNAVFRFILQQGPPMMNAAGINALGMKFNGEVGPTFSSVMTIVVGLGLMISIGVFAKILKQQRGQDGFDKPEYKEKYGTLTEGFSTKTAIGTYWNVLILIRWLYTTAVLISLRDHSEFQIICLLIASVVFQALILHGKPMPSPIENRFSVFNEMMVSLYLYTLMHLTDFFGDNKYREEGGYVLVGIIFVSVAVNLIKFFALIIREIKFQIKLRRKAKIDQQKQTVDSFDPNQAQTLCATPGIFAYTEDIIKQQNQLEDNDGPRDETQKLTVFGTIPQLRSLNPPGDLLAQTFGQKRTLNHHSILENYRSPINLQPLSVLSLGPESDLRMPQDKTLKDIFQENLALKVRLDQTYASNQIQNDRLLRQQINQIGQRNHHRMQQQHQQLGLLHSTSLRMQEVDIDDACWSVTHGTQGVSHIAP